MATVTLAVNGTRRRLEESSLGEPLLGVLRGRLGLTGAKEACGLGECGLCTVLIDGAPRLACVTLVGQAAGRSVVTIEGLAASQRDLREAFADAGAFQCGFCTPGQIVLAAALLANDPDPSEEVIRAWMSGVICRCTGYGPIVRAIRKVALARRSAPADQGSTVPAAGVTGDAG